MSKNLIGQKFGRLTVVEADGKTASRHTKWLCQCECGKTKSVVSRDLLNGHTQSCGCLQREKVTKHGYRKIGNTERLYNVWHGIILCVPLSEVYRVIAGHSDYHGDNILAALTCIAAGKEVKPVRPLPADQWIPCSERLPENDGYYETTIDILGCRLNKPICFDTVENRWLANHCVIAWRERLEPYKGE